MLQAALAATQRGVWSYSGLLHLQFMTTVYCKCFVYAPTYSHARNMLCRLHSRLCMYVYIYIMQCSFYYIYIYQTCPNERWGSISNDFQFYIYIFFTNLMFTFIFILSYLTTNKSRFINGATEKFILPNFTERFIATYEICCKLCVNAAATRIVMKECLTS